MALAETANLIVNLSLKGNFARQLGSANRALGTFDAKLDHTESRAYRAGQQIGTGIKRGATLAAVGVGVLASQVVLGLDSLVKLEAQTDATNAAIKATGGVAGITADEVRKMAEDFESVNALFGDEVIQSAENMLLAFTNIRKKAFKPTLQAALDLNAGLGKDPDGLADTAKILGIALNDPTKGLGRLSRAGVTFTKEQTKRIKALQKEGKLYEAQAIILKEIEKRFGGRGAAFGGETAKKVAKFQDAIEDLQRTLAIGFLPVVSNIADALDELFRDPEVQNGVKEFGQNLAAVFTKDNIKSGIATIKDVFSTIAAVAGPAAAAVGAMVNAFSKLPPDLRNLLIGAFAVNKLTGGLVTNIAGGIGGALKNLVTGSMNVEAGVVNVAGGVPGGAAGPAGAAGAAGKGGGLSGILGTALKGLGVLFVAQIADDIHEAIKPPTTATSDLSWPWGPKNTPKILPNLGIPGLLKLTGENGILGGTPTPTKGAPADHFGAKDQQKKLADIALQVQRKGEQTAGKLDDTKSAVDDTKTKVGTTGQAIQNTTRSSALTNAAIGAAATAASTAAIVGAIYAARPIVNVTNVTKSTTIQNRYGPGNGSQGVDNGHAGNSGPLP